MEIIEQLQNIKSGERICYHEGITGRGRHSIMLLASELYEEGKVTLVQQKVTDTNSLNIYKYIAVGV